MRTAAQSAKRSGHHLEKGVWVFGDCNP